jgi:recombination protein RecA
MGRKKKEQTEEQEEGLDSGTPKFFEDYKDVIFSAKAVTGDDKKIISVSPSFDLMTGGIPEGSFIALTGREKIGKTLLALSIAAQAQRMEYANPELCPNGRVVFFLNAEHRIKKRDLEGIYGLDLSDEKFHLVQSSPGHIISSQEFCTIAERAIHEVPGSVVIIDSFSILSPEEELAADIGYQDRGKRNGIISQLMRKIAAPLCVNKCIVIGITHGMANTSGMGAWFIEKSATSLKYAEDIKLVGKGVERWRLGEDERTPQIGQKVDWLVEFSAILPPGGVIKSHIRYGSGVDRFSELAEIAEQFGLVQKTGAKSSWYTLSFMGEDGKKVQGMEAVRDILESEPGLYEKLRKQVYDISGIKL